MDYFMILVEFGEVFHLFLIFLFEYDLCGVAMYNGWKWSRMKLVGVNGG